MLNILITPLRYPIPNKVGEVHISHDSHEKLFDRLVHNVGGSLPEDSYGRCVKHTAQTVAEANEFVKDFIEEYWICWCDDPRSYLEVE